MQWLTVILAVMNIAGFIMMGTDKKRARNQEWRIPETNLFGAAFLGGALGVLAGMKVFRHKTQHLSFRYGIPALLVFNIAVVYYMVSKLGM
ncbi:membrane protein [Paenibacillus swuensis]|uniref:Membrane protein n=1 Tax=Paenibacillus swuensis TaxID=1178515 RepID=A0A172TFF0_9BACL|nr:DUF1294 domain-containing protein [Paenibacillus swuensis]ANE45634.1 membrane protein [Paenibacillus swuensis]